MRPEAMHPECDAMSWLLETILTFALMFECVAVGVLIHRGVAVVSRGGGGPIGALAKLDLPAAEAVCWERSRRASRCGPGERGNHR